MRSILKKMLYRMQCFEAIEEAVDGEEGWHRLRTEIFHLVIADINMPRLNGIELLKRCRGESDLRNVPFLIVSGESLQEVIAFVGEWGVYDYVVKPFSYSILKSRIEAMFERLRNPEELLYREVERLKEMGYHREALQRVEEAEASLKALKVKWLTIKGECLMALGSMESAEECLNRALELSDVYLPAHKTCAELHLKRGNTDRAIELLTRADEISPLDTDRKVKLGKLFLGQGRDDEGRVVLEKAVRQSSQGERAGILRKVAEAFMEANHYAEAEELFVKLLKLSPEEVETYNRLGIALRRQGKYDEAEAYYRMALESHPHNPVIHYNLGVLQFSRQEKENARNSLLEAVRLDPGFTRAREVLRQVEASG
ncbi:MAG: tetratricopeptide repeat protein [Syntrophobacteraceae bacterium]|nr:tetratricopeptide repeat protein [Syntrophobacteraceae bacterium]